MLKFAILGALGYAAYWYLDKTGSLPTNNQINDLVDTVKEKVGIPKSEPKRASP